MTNSSLAKIVSELTLAHQHILRLKVSSLNPESNWMPGVGWHLLFDQPTILNEFQFFLKMKYTTKQSDKRIDKCDTCLKERLAEIFRKPAQRCHDHLHVPSAEDTILKHIKFIGFLESRLRLFMVTLQDLLGCNQGILLDSRGPYHDSPLESFFLVSLPIERLDD